ncbi:hypothetical protein JCM9279_007652 [Rhodotorula babjevae]
MSLARRLPLNVQVLICSYLAPRAPLARLPSGAARLHATVSLAAPPPDRPLAAVQPAQAFTQNTQLAQQAAEAVFEEPSDEYSNVPLSTLDHPAVPRSPDDSLLSLLDADKPQDARRLLHELRASGQHIPRRYAFFKHARTLAVGPARAPDDPAPAVAPVDLLVRNEHGERDWLEWWKLAPVITDPVHDEVVDLRDVDKAMGHAAKVLVRQLRVAPALNGATGAAGAAAGGAGPGDGTVDEAFALLEEFSLVLCRQGYAYVVAREALPYLTAYAPLEVGERVFATALRSLRQQRTAFVAQGAYLSRLRSARMRAGQQLSASSRHAVGSRIVRRRAASTRTWFVNRVGAALEALGLARGAAIVRHANLGRLETAVELVVASLQRGSTFALARVKVKRTVYLHLLALLAERDEFALFERVYDSLRSGARRLTRTRSAPLRERTPFLIRGSTFDPADVAPSAREAFLAWRYQNAVSLIEEGPEGVARLVEDEERDATGEHGVPLHREVHRNTSLTLVRLVEHDDEGGSRFADSSRIVAEALAESSRGGQATVVDSSGGIRRRRVLPSANALAVWILHAQRLAEHGDRRAGRVLNSLAWDACRRSAGTRALWAAATMLADIKAQRYGAALEAYKAHFDIVALAPRMRMALRNATDEQRLGLGASSGRRARSAKRATMPPSAYTLALLVQALVPWYAERVTTARYAAGAAHARAVVAELYDELLVEPPSSSPSPSVSSVALIPSRTRARRDAAAPGPTSPLDPHTFMPFLADHLRQRAPLQAAAVLVDMHERGIEPQPPHYSVVLNAFARGGSVRRPRQADGDGELEAGRGGDAAAQATSAADLLFLLRLFERRAGAAEAAAAVGGSSRTIGTISPAVRALAARLPVPAADDAPLGVHAYTGILSGLRRRGERPAALEVLQGLMDGRPGDVRQWARSDERFRNEVVLLGKASGVSAASTL